MMVADPHMLPDALLERILERLLLPRRPEADLDGLATVYAAWSRAVPFDNLRKLIHLASDEAARPLAGDDPHEFFEAWLAWGTGGTCWAGNGALCVLLQSLGFEAVRGVGTMMVAPNLPPNHGTVVAAMDGRRYLLDASMLFAQPLLLDAENESCVEHPARGVRCTMRDEKWHVRWRPLHMPDGLDCRIDALAANATEFSERHEATRGWSPFNYQVNARRNREDAVVGIAFGNRVEIDAQGRATMQPLSDTERLRILIEDIGIHPELAERVPADRPTPPPPASRSVAGEGAA